MIKDFISLFFPKVCLTCNGALTKGVEEVCVNCLKELPKTDNHLLKIPEFEHRFTGIIDFEHVLVYLFFQKKGIVQKLLHELKYNDNPELGTKLGMWYGKELVLNGFNDEFDIIIPIPLHKSKYKTRGYNQSEVFGEGLSISLKCPMLTEELLRVKASETQTNKSRVARWGNVEGVFKVKEKQNIEGKRVLLVDDVLTTGSTLVAATEPLLKAGVKSVSFAVLAAAK